MTVSWIPLMIVSWIPCACVFCSGELLGTTPHCSCRESPFLSCFQPRHSEHHSNTKPLLTCLSNLSTTRSAEALLLKSITQRQTDSTENLRAAPLNSAFVGKLAASNKPSSPPTVSRPHSCPAQLALSLPEQTNIPPLLPSQTPLADPVCVLSQPCSASNKLLNCCSALECCLYNTQKQRQKLLALHQLTAFCLFLLIFVVTCLEGLLGITLIFSSHP
ncbi:hypothetical protein ILYODFUR_038893 [Ilyodon furcidens]|uniref:Uncharacterized protein n=1 Tax=Ilyodon furcidens TaxID=33524 RepID=A0ABV0UQR1_9TELE